MAKSLQKVKLTGRLRDDTIAKTHQSGDVEYFRSENNLVSIRQSLDGLIVITPNGQFEMEKHPSQNYYHAVNAGYKIQCTLKKVVGEMRYWA